MKKQVEKNHYEFREYLHKGRWASMWHQLDEIIKLKPSTVLEIGPGPGLLKAAGNVLGLHIKTLDLDPELSPDYLGSACEIPVSDKEFDIVCAFQMLEHIPFDKTLAAFTEMVRVARKAVIISLPDSSIRLPISIFLPKFGIVEISIPIPRLKSHVHKFDGEHYWEINKKGYSVSYVEKKLLSCGNLKLEKTFRVHENPYHRFFIFTKINL